MSKLELRLDPDVIIIDKFLISDLMELRLIEENSRDISIELWINSEPFMEIKSLIVYEDFPVPGFIVEKIMAILDINEFDPISRTEDIDFWLYCAILKEWVDNDYKIGFISLDWCTQLLWELAGIGDKKAVNVMNQLITCMKTN